MSLQRIKEFLNKKYKTEKEEELIMQRKWEEYLRGELTDIPSEFMVSRKVATTATAVKNKNASSQKQMNGKMPLIQNQKKSVTIQQRIKSSKMVREKIIEENESDNSNQFSSKSSSAEATSDEDEEKKSKEATTSDEETESVLNDSQSLNSSRSGLNSSFQRYKIYKKENVRVDSSKKETPKTAYSAESVKKPTEKNSNSFKNIIKNAFRIPSGENNTKNVNVSSKKKEETEESESESDEEDDDDESKNSESARSKTSTSTSGSEKIESSKSSSASESEDEKKNDVTIQTKNEEESSDDDDDDEEDENKTIVNEENSSSSESESKEESEESEEEEDDDEDENSKSRVSTSKTNSTATTSKASVNESKTSKASKSDKSTSSESEESSKNTSDNEKEESEDELEETRVSEKEKLNYSSGGSSDSDSSTDDDTEESESVKGGLSVISEKTEQRTILQSESVVSSKDNFDEDEDEDEKTESSEESDDEKESEDEDVKSKEQNKSIIIQKNEVSIDKKNSSLIKSTVKQEEEEEGDEEESESTESSEEESDEESESTVENEDQKNASKSSIKLNEVLNKKDLSLNLNKSKLKDEESEAEGQSRATTARSEATSEAKSTEKDESESSDDDDEKTNKSSARSDTTTPAAALSNRVSTESESENEEINVSTRRSEKNQKVKDESEDDDETNKTTTRSDTAESIQKKESSSSESEGEEEDDDKTKSLNGDDASSPTKTESRQSKISLQEESDDESVKGTESNVTTPSVTPAPMSARSEDNTESERQTSISRNESSNYEKSEKSSDDSDSDTVSNASSLKKPLKEVQKPTEEKKVGIKQTTENKKLEESNTTKPGILKSTSLTNMEQKKNQNVRISENERIEHKIETTDKLIQDSQIEKKTPQSNSINSSKIEESFDQVRGFPTDLINLINEKFEPKLGVNKSFNEISKSSNHQIVTKTEGHKSQESKFEDTAFNESEKVNSTEATAKPSPPKPTENLTESQKVVLKRLLVKSPTKLYRGAKINIAQTLEKPPAQPAQGGKSPVMPVKTQTVTVVRQPLPPKQPINFGNRPNPIHKTIPPVKPTVLQTTVAPVPPSAQQKPVTLRAQANDTYEEVVLEPNNSTGINLTQSITINETIQLSPVEDDDYNSPSQGIVKAKPIKKPLFIEHGEIILPVKKDKPPVPANNTENSVNESDSSIPFHKRDRTVRINSEVEKDDDKIYDPDSNKPGFDEKEKDVSVVMNVKKKANVVVDIKKVNDKQNANTGEIKSLEKKNMILKELERETTAYKPLLNKSVTQLIIRSPGRKSRNDDKNVGITILSEKTPKSIEIKFNEKKDPIEVNKKKPLKPIKSNYLGNISKAKSNEELSTSSRRATVKKSFSQRETKRTRGDLDNNGFETPVYSKLLKPIMQRDATTSGSRHESNNEMTNSVLTNRSFDIPNILDMDNDYYNDDDDGDANESKGISRLPLSSPTQQTTKQLNETKEYSASYDNLTKLATPRNAKISAKMLNKGQYSDRTKNNKKVVKKKEFLIKDQDTVSRSNYDFPRGPNTTPLPEGGKSDLSVAAEATLIEGTETPVTARKKTKKTTGNSKRAKVLRANIDRLSIPKRTVGLGDEATTNQNKLINLRLKMSQTGTASRTPRSIHNQTTVTEDSNTDKRFDYLHRSFPNPPKSPYTAVPKSALSFTATERLIELSRPKLKKDYLIREEFPKDTYEPAYSGVLNRAALSFTATVRLEELSKSKSVCEMYRFSRPLPEIIPPSAKTAEPTIRIVELAKPKSAMK